MSNSAYPTTTISPDKECTTFINIFKTKDSEEQKEVIKMLEEVTDKVMRKLDGFISANVHVSEDGKSVMNYVQWKSKAHFEAALQNPQALEHINVMSGRFERIASIYRVIYTADKA